MNESTTSAIVVTVVEPELQSLVDAGGESMFRRVHARSVSEAFDSVRFYRAQMMLLSPSVVDQYPMSDIKNLVQRAPGVLPVVFLNETRARNDEALLALGACGVHHAVNVSEREGWSRLRRLAGEIGGETGTRIISALLAPLTEQNDAVRCFFGNLVRLAPTTTTVRAFGSQLGTNPSTLASRFFRAGLPTVRSYLAMTRLAYAASYFESPRVSTLDVVVRLRYSSPQCFCRHVLLMLGMTPRQYRQRFSLDTALEHFVNRLILPFTEVLNEFAPLDRGFIPRLSNPRRTSLR